MSTTNRIAELREERSKLLHDFRSELDHADKEKRPPDEELLDKLETAAHERKKLMERLRFVLREEQEEREANEATPPKSGFENLEKRGNEPPPFEIRSKSWGSRKFDPADPMTLRASDEYRAAFWGNLVSSRGGYAFPDYERMAESEFRSLQADVDAQAGYLTMPSTMIADLIEKVDDMVHIRRLARVIPVPNAHSVGIPSRENDIADSDWVTELAIGTEDTTLDYGKRTLTPHGLSKLIKVSLRLLRLGVISAEAEVMSRLAYKDAVTQEKGFLTGTGNQQPLGVFTANSSGISTTQDVSTDNTTTAITADNLKRCKWTLKAPYRQRARWLFHRDAIALIMRLKDGNGQYLIREGIAEDGGDMLLGVPMLESEFAPNTFTTGQYVGIIGDFSNYWIADGMEYQVQRLVELYAATNQVGLIARHEVDGMPVLEEAFVRVTLA